MAIGSVASAQQTAPVAVSSGVSYAAIDRWDIDKLNKILTVDTPAFAGIDVPYTAAKNAVTLYRVTYNSVVPERGNKPIVATGLVAIPEGITGPLPMVSYQHGTVYEKTQVPSFSRAIARNAIDDRPVCGQGYVLIGADYFGMGSSQEPEGYMVKGSHQQATADMLAAAKSVRAERKVQTTDLYLAGCRRAAS